LGLVWATKNPAPMMFGFDAEDAGGVDQDWSIWLPAP
jgi:hypothetical protein